MSPEQARGERVTDPRSDVYSLGVTLYELLTLRPAFPATDRQALLRQVLNDDPVPARRINRTIPVELEVVVHKAMAKSPADRYPSARALADDLRAWLDDRPIRGRPPTVGQRAARWARRHRGAVIGTAVALALVAVGLLTSTVLAVAALGERDAAVAALTDRQEKTDAALSREQQAKADLAAALAGEQRAAYGYRVPLAQQAAREGDIPRAGQLLADCPPPLRGWEWHYLNRRLDPAAVVVRPALDPKSYDPGTFLRYSMDGRSVLIHTPGGPGGPPYVHAWDADTAREAGLFLAPADAGPDVEISPDGHRFATFSHATRPPEGAAVIGPHYGGTVRVFDIRSGAQLFRLAGPAAGVTAVAFGSDGRRIAVAGFDGTVMMADAAIGAPVWTVRGSGEPALNVALSPDGATVATLTCHRVAYQHEGPRRFPNHPTAQLHFRDADTGAVRGHVPVLLNRPLPERFYGLDFGPDGKHLAVTLGLTVGLKLLTVPDGRDVALPEGAMVRGFSPDGRRVVYFLPDGTGGMAELASGQQTAHFALGEPIGRYGAADVLNLPRRPALVSPDGRRAAFAHGDGRVSVWDAATGAEVATFRAPAQVRKLAIRPDGRQVAGVVYDGSILVWDLAAAGDGRPLVPTAVAKVAAVAVSPDGHTLATLGDPSYRHPGDDSPSEIVLWDLAAGRERLRRTVPGAKVYWADVGIGGLSFSPDGQRLTITGVMGVSKFLTADGKGTLRRVLRVWDVARGVEVEAHEYDPPNEAIAGCVAPPEVFGARFTPAGVPLAYLVTRTSRTQEPARYTLAVEQPGRAEPVWSLAADCLLGPMAVSPDGRLAAVSCGRGRAPAPALRVWDVSAGRLLWELPPDPAGRLLDALFSPDGRRLLSTPLNGDPAGPGGMWHSQAVIWDTATGQAVCRFRPPVVNAPFGRHARSRFVFSPDGRRLASFGGMPGVKLWDAATGQELLTPGGPDLVGDAVFSPVGWLVTRGLDGSVRVWDGRPAAGPWQPPPAAEELAKQSRTLANAPDPARRDPVRAVELAREAVRAYPNRPILRITLGLAECRAGDAAAATASLEQSLALGAGVNQGICYFLLAEAQQQFGRPAAARTWFDRGERWLRGLPDRPGIDGVRAATRRYRADAAAALEAGD